MGGWDEWNKKNKKSDEREKRENFYMMGGVDGVVVNLLYRIKSLAQWKVTDERENWENDFSHRRWYEIYKKRKSTQNCMHIEAC